MSSNNDKQNSKLQYLEIGQLETNPFQPRERIKTEDIQELSESIRQHGVIEPLVVAQTPAGFQIIAGERRWRAAKLANLKEVPVSIIKTTPRQMLELALVENVQRQDLHAIERAKGFQQLMREFGLKVTQVAQRIGKSPSYISNSLKLLELPDLIKDAVINGSLTEGHARALSSLETESEQIECYRQIISDKSSVRDAEAMVRNKKDEKAVLPKYLKKPSVVVKNEVLVKVKKQLSSELKAPVSLNLRRSGTQTRLTITLKGDERQTESSLKSLLQLLNNSQE